MRKQEMNDQDGKFEHKWKMMKMDVILFIMSKKCQTKGS